MSHGDASNMDAGLLKTIREECGGAPMKNADLAALIRQNAVLRKKLRHVLGAVSPCPSLLARAEQLHTSRSERSAKRDRPGILVPWHNLVEVFPSDPKTIPRAHRRESSTSGCSGIAKVNDSEDERSTQVPSSDSDSPNDFHVQSHRSMKPGALLAPGLVPLAPQLRGAPLLAGLELDVGPAAASAFALSAKSKTATGGDRRPSCRRSSNHGFLEPGAGVQIRTMPANCGMGTVVVVDRAAGNYKVRMSNGEVAWVKAENVQLMGQSPKAC